MTLDIAQWSLAILASFLIGLSKAGIKGIGIFIVTILVFVFGGKASTGILMPMLIVGDIFAVIYYYRHVEWKYIVRLMPWMAIGVLVGVYFGKDMPEDLFRNIMAVIIIVSVVIMLWWERRKSDYVPQWYGFGVLIGGLAGFTTMIGNLAGAFANIYFLVMRLPKNAFIGTAAWLFFLINLFKLPFHIFSWHTINGQSLFVNLKLLPFQLIGLWAGVTILQRVEDDFFRRMILVLTAIGAIVILIK
jgi:hypothetical protein